MLTMKPLLPIRALISDPLWPDRAPADTLAPEPPTNDGPLAGPLAVLTWPDGARQFVRVVYEDGLLREARVRFWVRTNGRAESKETFVPLGWLAKPATTATVNFYSDKASDDHHD